MQCRFLSAEEFRQADDARLALGKKRGEDKEWLREHDSNYGYASLHEITGPCVMWYADWYFDPANPDHQRRRDNALAAIKEGTFGKGERNYYLSRMYWEQWSDKRPPIAVLCPNGAEWVVDAKSSNGDGWTVTGEVPRITCNPSILVPGYHGFLRDGVFTESI